jgi:two-component system, LytTR family, response regulator LytT
MKILLVDDERTSRVELKHLLLELNDSMTIVEADSCENALSLLKAFPFTGAFFDIELLDGKGTDLARQALLLQPDLNFVFSTAYDQFALSAFELNALDYILKPFNPKDIQRAYDRLLKRERIESPAKVCAVERITVWSDDKAYVIGYNDIIYITSLNKKILLVTKNKTYTINQSLELLDQRLSSCGFTRVQRSFIINLNKVTEILPWFNNAYALKLQDIDTVIPISRQKTQVLRDYFEF